MTNSSNIPVPPLKERVHILGSVLIAKLAVFKVVGNKVVKGWVMEASMLWPPVACAVQRKNKLGQRTLDKKTNKCGHGRTCVAVYAMERGVTCPFSPNILATSRRLLVRSLGRIFSLDAEEGDVNI